MNKFFNDVWEGLNATPKRLSSKYFYDEAGDKLFQEIMQTPEYYLTNCELEIFSEKTDEISELMLSHSTSFDLVELGAGDAMKSTFLLKNLQDRKADFVYYPIDISAHVIENLSDKLPDEIPGIRINGMNGEYFDMLKQIKKISSRKKVVLFLGSSIGNIPFEHTGDFLNELHQQLNPGDLLLTGFDLKKDPRLILAAYNDASGATKRFNLNLLQRINRELDADFNLAGFEHYPVYDEASGACKSYLKSLSKQRVRIGEVGWVHFAKGEMIFMEISQKYSLQQTDELARANAFKPVKHIFDNKEWFLDTIWQVVT